MKAVAKFLAGIALVVVAVLAYLIFGSGLNIQVESRVVAASEEMDVYQRLTGSREGAEDCSIVHITVEAKNRGILPAEWVELHFSTADGDVLAYDVAAGPADMAGFQSRTFTASILTRNPGPRSAWLSYYLMGREQLAE